MPKSSKSSKKTSIAQPETAALDATISDLPVRAGMPAKDSIIGVSTPQPTGALAAAGVQYRIFHTNEVDEYEKVETTVTALAAAAKKLPTGDSFKGTARKAAKLSLATAKTEEFSDVKDLIASLAAESDMKNHKPPITTVATSNRVKEEKRNIQVSAFIYAASREDDNDFHLIVGRDPDKSPEMYMTMELSGLPSSSSAAFKKLKAARDAFKKFFDDNFEGELPGLSYDFYDPPIAVEVEGSLFFDMTHASGSRPGPKSLKSRMPVIWEVHPISKMTFES
jgi:hypothetical protein